MSGQFQKVTLGSFTGYALAVGKREADLSVYFFDVPEDELTAAVAESDYGRMTVISGYNVLLMDTGDKKVLIDLGLGSTTLLESLEPTGISPEDITQVIITHSDGDHIGGMFTEENAFTFPNARYAYWDTAWDRWTNQTDQVLHELSYVFAPMLSDEPERLERMLAVRRYYAEKTLPRIKDRVDLFSLDEDILPGFRYLDTRAHRGDHASLAITSGGETLIHVADSIRHPVQIKHPDWYTHYESYPEKLEAVNRMLLDRIFESDALVFGTHFSWPPVVRFSREGRFVPVG